MSPTVAPRRRDLIALLKERSLQFGSFTLASGRPASYYIDARRTTMSARGLELVGQLGLAAIREAGWQADLIGGMTLGADPVAFAIAMASLRAPPALDAFTVRKQAKVHGTGQRLEGCFRPHTRVVVVEDVLTSGASALAAASAISEAGGQVVGILVVVDRREGGRAALEGAGHPVRVLVTVDDLVENARPGGPA